MKKIEAIVRPNKVSDVCAALDKVGHPGLMVTQIEGQINPRLGGSFFDRVGIGLTPNAFTPDLAES